MDGTSTTFWDKEIGKMDEKSKSLKTRANGRFAKTWFVLCGYFLFWKGNIKRSEKSKVFVVKKTKCNVIMEFLRVFWNSNRNKLGMDRRKRKGVGDFGVCLKTEKINWLMCLFGFFFSGFKKWVQCGFSYFSNSSFFFFNFSGFF